MRDHLAQRRALARADGDVHGTIEVRLGEAVVRERELLALLARRTPERIELRVDVPEPAICRDQIIDRVLEGGRAPSVLARSACPRGSSPPAEASSKPWKNARTSGATDMGSA